MVYLLYMASLSSCNSWKDLKKPPNPFYGAMFSKSHRKRKKKKALKPIDNPRERGRSLETSKESLNPDNLRSYSVENSAVLKLNHEICRKTILDPNSQAILSTESSLEIKLPPKPPSKLFIPKPLSTYLELDKAIESSSINIRKKSIRPSHPDDPKPLATFKRGRKYIKSPKGSSCLPYAPDLKPVSLNSFQMGLPRIELEVNEFFELTKSKTPQFEDLIKTLTCKFCLQ
jgi:hypothetical protein